MEGIYFFWIAWSAWVYTTFLMPKNTLRLYVSMIILISIILSSSSVLIYGYEVNIALIFLAVISYVYVSRLKFFRLLYYFIVTVIITLAYVSFSLFALYDPVWVMFDYTLMLAFTMVILTLLLVKEQLLRVVSLVIGAAHGEAVYSIILGTIFYKKPIGMLFFFDMLAVAFLGIFLWKAFELLVVYMDSYSKRYVDTKEATRNG